MALPKVEPSGIFENGLILYTSTKVEASIDSKQSKNFLEASNTSDEGKYYKKSQKIDKIVKAVMESSNKLRVQDIRRHVGKMVEGRSKYSKTKKTRLSGGQSRQTLNRREQQRSETHEETEMRLLRQRLLVAKSRLIMRLEAPAKLEKQRKFELGIHDKRKRVRPSESLEKAAERKRRNAAQVRKCRSVRQAIETPEQKVQRHMKAAAQRKASRALESPEERLEFARP